MPGERSEKERELVLRLGAELYHRLEEEATKYGFSSVSDYVIHLLSTQVRIAEHGISGEGLEKIRSRLERFLQDELNKRLAQFETVRRQVIEIYERLDSLEQRISELNAKIKDLETRRTEVVPLSRARKTAIERLKEEKILFESTLPPRIQRDRLFAYLEREGAVIVKLSKERVAIDPDFWAEFKSKLSELHTIDENEILRVLGEKGFALWKALHSDGLIIYDSKLKRWRPVYGELT